MKKIGMSLKNKAARPRKLSKSLSPAFLIGLVVVVFAFGSSCKQESPDNKQAKNAGSEVKGADTAKDSETKKTDQKQVAPAGSQTKSPAPAEGSAPKDGKEKNVLWSMDRDGFSPNKPKTQDQGSGASELLAKLNQDLPPIPEHTELSGPASLTLLYNSGAFGELDSCG